MRRSWRNYTKERLLRKLENVTWETGYDSVQDMWNDYEQSIMTIIDELIPLEAITTTSIKQKKNHSSLTQVSYNDKTFKKTENAKMFKILTWRLLFLFLSIIMF